MFFKVSALKDFAVFTGKVLELLLNKIIGLNTDSGYITLEILFYEIEI